MVKCGSSKFVQCAHVKRVVTLKIIHKLKCKSVSSKRSFTSLVRSFADEGRCKNRITLLTRGTRCESEASEASESSEAYYCRVHVSSKKSINYADCMLFGKFVAKFNGGSNSYDAINLLTRSVNATIQEIGGAVYGWMYMMGKVDVDAIKNIVSFMGIGLAFPTNIESGRVYSGSNLDNMICNLLARRIHHNVGITEEECKFGTRDQWLSSGRRISSCAVPVIITMAHNFGHKFRVYCFEDTVEC